MMKKIFISLFLGFLISGFINSGHAETNNRVVAIVNDEVITLYELNKKIEEMTGLKSEDIRSRDEKKYLATRREVLDILINEKITQEKIRELNIQATQEQVDAAIEDIKKRNHLTQEDLIEGLKSQGISFEKYKETIKNELERSRLINYEVNSKIIIREEQIREYYNDHKDKYTRDGRFHLAGILLKKPDPNDEKGSRELYDKGKEILEKLKNGEDFAELAIKFSQGPGSGDGGDLGIFASSEIDPDLLKILKDLPEGGISSLIDRENVLQIIKLIKREDAEVIPFENAKDSIFEILYKEEINKRYLSWIQTLRENTFTKIIF